MRTERAWIDIGNEYWDREAKSYGPGDEDDNSNTDDEPTQEIVIVPTTGPVFGPVGDDEIPF